MQRGNELHASWLAMEIQLFRKMMANATTSKLRLLIQSENTSRNSCSSNSADERPVRSHLHPDYHRLLHDRHLHEFGASRCHFSPSFIDDIILFGCLTFPHCLPHRLPSIINFTAWLFFFDDLFDDAKLLGEDPASAAALQSLLLRSFAASPNSSFPATRSAGIDDRLLDDVTEGAAKWWGEFREQGMTPAQQRCFLDRLEAYAAAIVEQTRYNSAASFPADRQAYDALRADASCVQCYNVLVEYSMGIDVTSELRNVGGGVGRTLKALELNAVLEMVWFNDMRSLEKEIEEGDRMNLILYLYVNDRRGRMNGHGCVGDGDGELEEEEMLGMVKAAFKVANAMVGECRMNARRLETKMKEELLGLEACRQIPNSAHILLRYVTGIDSLTTGLTNWHDETRRYSSSSNSAPC